MASKVRMRRIFSIVMASVQNIGITAERNTADNERTPHATGMSKETSPLPMNRTQGKESYWFANGRPEDASPGNLLADPKTTAEQKDREEKMRVFREQQEEERLRKLQSLEQQFLLAKKHREQQEEERRHRIEEARLRETERRHQVEERKRQIWEAEQERKEAILRRNMEREARIEARRNAQRNSQSFAFGSSTPRSFDLDLAAIGLGRNTSTVLMSSVGRRSEEREPPRATSACSLDRKFESDSVGLLRDSSRSSSLETMPSFAYKPIALQQKSSHDMKACLSMLENNLCNPSHFFHRPSLGWLVGSGVLVGEDCMSRSMVSLSSSTFRGRRRTDITPTPSRERSVTPHVAPRGNPPCMRAVSMTRLDQLAQPRRTYRDPCTTPDATVSPAKSMCNLAPPANRRARGSPADGMSRSMLHLAAAPRRQSPSPTLAISSMRSAQSMMHLAAPPRLTRAARLRAEALAGSRAASAWNLNKVDGGPNGCYLSPGKDSSRSPPRPQSSMSGASDISATSSSVSAVNMRPRPAPRRPRPYSVAGSVVNIPPAKEPDRQPRGHDRSVPAPRAKSACREGEEPKRPLSAAPKKPLPPPKSSDLLSRAKSHPVPTKDNLRKINKTLSKPVNKIPAEEKDKSSEEQTVTDKIECKRKEVAAEEEVHLDSAVTSPTTDSEMLPASSGDSETAVNESEPRAEEASAEDVRKVVREATVEQNIPNEEKGAESGAAPPKPRISSEEEAKAALAEKRRLAREQAEREAELERRRLEEIRRCEEEQQEKEEQEQRRMEQEQIRLAELHRQLEQQKLARAIEEQQQREREDQERRDEEAKQRLEKEEQEKKAREEAERQRVELEEKLRKEEDERAERKRRVEQIMARTRGKAAAQSPSGTPAESRAAPTTLRGADIPNGTSEAWAEQKPLPDILNAAIHSAKRNGAFTPSETANSLSVSNRTLSANEDVSPQSNGYGSHENMSCTTSPEESSEVGLLIDIQSNNRQQRSSAQLVDPLGNVNNENFLIRVDDVNSNLVGSPFADTLQKDARVADLLS